MTSGCRANWRSNLHSPHPDVAIIYGRTVLFDSQRGNLRDYDHSHEFSALPEGDIFSLLFSHACFIAMSSAMLRRCRADGSWQGTTEHPGGARLLSLRRSGANTTRRVRYRKWCAGIACTPAACRHRTSIGVRLHEEPPIDHPAVGFAVGSATRSLSAERRIPPRWLGRNAGIRDRLAGFRRLLSEGSPGWLISRPFAIAWRSIRRKLHRPYWLATEFASDPD